MPALIDNYTTINLVDEKQLKSTTPFYNTYFYHFVSSITFSSANDFGLNNKILKLLNEFGQLSDNWDNDDALAPNQTNLQKAIFVTQVLEKHGQPIFHATPGPNGEIMLDIRNEKKTKSIEIIFYPQKAVSVLFPEEGIPSQQEFEFDMLPQLLEWLNMK